MPDSLVDGADLAGMSRSSNLLQKMGYDPDEVRANPALRAEVLAKVAGPYSAQQTPAKAPVEVAQQVTPPPPGAGQRTVVPPGQMLNPKSQDGGDISAPPGQPRLINRQQPTVPIPPRSVPSTVGAPPTPTPQSVAGAAPTSPSVSPSGTAAPAAPSAPNIDVDNSREAVKKLLSDQPELPNTTREDAMIDAKSVPINPLSNPKMYKESGWGKVGREFQAGAEGFLKRGPVGAIAGFIDPHIVGAKAPGDPNNNYDLDENTRRSQLALAQSDRQNALDDFKRRTDQRTQQNVGSRDAGEISNGLVKLPNETTTANADLLRAQDAGNPKNEQEAIAAYGRETDPAKKAALWDTVQKMHDATMSERPPKEGPIPSAELQEFSDWKRAFVRDNKRQPTAAEINAYRGKGGGTTTLTPQQWQQLVSQHDKEYADAQKAKDAELKAGVSTPEEIEQKYDSIAADLQARWNERYAQADPEGKYANGVPAPATAPPPKGGGKQLIDTTIAAQYLAQAGGDKAKARKLAAKDGWKF